MLSFDELHHMVSIKEHFRLEPILDIRCKFFFQIQVKKVLKQRKGENLLTFPVYVYRKIKVAVFVYQKHAEEKNN